MQVGDLIKHKRNNSIALVLRVTLDRQERDPEYDREWATVLFNGDERVSVLPLKLIKENWEVLDGKA